MHDTHIADCITGAMSMMQERRRKDHEPPAMPPTARFFPAPGPRPRVQSSAVFERFWQFYFCISVSFWRTPR